MAADLLWRSRLLLASLVFSEFPFVSSLCPKGFGGDDIFFPEQWNIPKWPDTSEMDPEQLAELKVVKLGGFRMNNMNDEFLEGPTDEFLVQGKKSFWSASGEHFLYWCERFQKWRIAGVQGFSKNKDGQCLAYVSDGTPSRDIADPALIKGWIEVENGQWVVRENAGVVEISTLADAIQKAKEEHGGAAEEEAPGAAEEPQAAEVQAAEQSNESVNDSNMSANGTNASTGNKTKAKQPKCPVMPVFRKGAKVAKKAVKDMTRWVRTMLPSLLAPPSDEPDEPEEEEEEAEEEGEEPDNASTAATFSEESISDAASVDAAAAAPSVDTVGLGRQSEL